MTKFQRRFPCPVCPKRFAKRASVMNHLNQPLSPCCSLWQSRQTRNPTKNRKSAHTSHHDPLHQTDLGDSPMDVDEPMDVDPIHSQTTSNPIPIIDPVSPSTHPNDAATPDDPWDSHSSAKNNTSYYIEEYPGAAQVFGIGPTFMDKFKADQYSRERQQNLYYPFASRKEWQLAEFLLQSNMSMTSINKFLQLDMIKDIKLSFRTAKDLRSRVEILPAGPQWRSKRWVPLHPTKMKVVLYYRDPLECLQSIMENPLVRDHINFKPMQIFRSAEKAMRVYTEWLSGDAAWRMQSEVSKVAEGATILGTILSSDKTIVSAMTGNRVVHPLLISLANLDMEFRTKSSNHAFLLLALLPVVTFVHRNKRIRGLLSDRLYHECVSFVCKPLKTAAQIGIMMNDPLGCRRFCFTPLVAKIVDTPESLLVAGVSGRTSSVTMAYYPQFGDNFRHEPRTASTTIAKLMAVEAVVDPWDLEAYLKEAQTHRLSGVHRPYWIDWPLSEPSRFLTSEPLHHWHKGFWDHDAKWCIAAVGPAEIDFRFSIQLPHTGHRHFKQGISTLKQVTGREHRDIQRYIIPIITGAVSKGFLVAVRALMDFRYLAQAPVIDEEMCQKIEAALKEFHDHKQSVLDAGARRGTGNAPIDNWYIPKLEFLQSVVPNIRDNGIASQWSADVTEHANITVIKDPARSSNNQNYEPQICRFLDRQDKCRRFDLATAVESAGVQFRPNLEGEEDFDDDSDADSDDDGSPISISATSKLLDTIDPMSALAGTSRARVNYFIQAARLAKSDTENLPRPLRTFSRGNVGFHLRRDPNIRRLTIDKAAETFKLPDFRPALHAYLSKLQSDGSHISGMSRRHTRGDSLPFNQVEIWTRMRLQTKSFHYPHAILPPKTINATPPSSEWPHGRCDAVIANLDPAYQWPESGLTGHQVFRLKMIFRIITNSVSGCDRFLCYVQRFDIVPQNVGVPGQGPTRGSYPEPSNGMYLLKPSRRAGTEETLMGDIIPLDQIRELVDLSPNVGDRADRRFTSGNAIGHSLEFWLNKYFTKELFFALHQ